MTKKTSVHDVVVWLRKTDFSTLTDEELDRVDKALMVANVKHNEQYIKRGISFEIDDEVE